MNEIRILEAITPSKIGGAEVFVASLCAQLAGVEEAGRDARRSHVFLWCPAGRPFVDYASGRGIEVVTWKTTGKIDPLTVVRLARLMRTLEIDVIHTHLSTAGLLGAFAAKLANRPSAAHVHGLNAATCYRFSTRIIAVSDAVKRHLAAQGIRQEKISVVHNGVDLGEFEPISVADAKRKLGYELQAPLFGVFGRLSPEKGQRVAIEAMFIALKDVPGARLVLAGVGRDWEDLRSSARALGIEDHVQFAGFVHNVRHLMAACDVVIVPSLREGFGLAAVEAMALGKPVIASATGGLAEIVLQGETGLLVAPNDPNALAQALVDLARDPYLAARLGASGRRRAEECFDLRKQVGLVLGVLRDVAQSHRRHPGRSVSS